MHSASDSRQMQADVVEQRYRRLVDHSPDAIAVHEGGRVVDINPAAEQHFQTVVNSLDYGVAVVGSDGRVESANPAVDRIFGTRPEVLKNRPANRSLEHSHLRHQRPPRRCRPASAHPDPADRNPNQ